MCGKGLDQKFLALPQKLARKADVIEYQKRSLAQPMTPTERLAVEPFHRHPLAQQLDGAQVLQGAAKQACNAQVLAMAVEHGPRRRMHQCPPAIVFWFVIPVARLRQRN